MILQAGLLVLVAASSCLFPSYEYKRALCGGDFGDPSCVETLTAGWIPGARLVDTAGDCPSATEVFDAGSPLYGDNDETRCTACSCTGDSDICVLHVLSYEHACDGEIKPTSDVVATDDCAEIPAMSAKQLGFVPRTDDGVQDNCAIGSSDPTNETRVLCVTQDAECPSGSVCAAHEGPCVWQTWDGGALPACPRGLGTTPIPLWKGQRSCNCECQTKCLGAFSHEQNMVMHCESGGMCDDGFTLDGGIHCYNNLKPDQVQRFHYCPDSTCTANADPDASLVPAAVVCCPE